ncbi:MAG: hypothetical protein ACRDNO_27055 [Trebonia sp.]
MSDGIGNDLAVIMRILEPLLISRVGFAVRVVEVVSRMSVFHLDAVHVPTGREWLGRRDRHGGVFWEARYRPVDPGVVYHLAAGDDPRSIAS